MDKPIIVVAGATGNLGSQITKYLLTNGANVRILVRPSSKSSRTKLLQQAGAEVYTTELSDLEAVTKACTDALCVVSAMAGLEETIIDAQTLLLNAAVKAGVPRFIPSDYSLDFNRFNDGENRNLDLRRKFHAILEQASIKPTSIFNGFFADMLFGQLPMILFKQHLVMYWGDREHNLIFTTVDNVAQYTAFAAMDNTTPRKLLIAGDQVSAVGMAHLLTNITNNTFRLIRTGGQGFLGIIIKIARFFSPGKNELYPAWQSMQYMHNMIDKRSILHKTDNSRYNGMQWTSVEELLRNFLK